MLYILGIITGLLIALLVVILILWQKPKAERLFNQTNSVLKEKGKIIEPEDESLEDWLDNLKNK